jgi:glutamine amidotransferase
MIAIVDYGLGNLKSVAKAFAYIGAAAEVTSEPARLRDAQGLVLPGVGAFGRGMENLRRAELDRPILAAVANGVPLLGICLGLQLMFESSEEAPGVAGLGILGGICRRFHGPEFERGELKSPHMGWNSLAIRNKTPLLRGLRSGSMVYFVHSYYAEPTRSSAIAATSAHGVEFCAVAAVGNVYACQFHPEKSGRWGLAILRNFVRSIGYGNHTGS